MRQVATIGLDLAKSAFQAHGVDAEGGAVIQQKLTRARLLKLFKKLSACLVRIEACGTAHHWARELMGLGHDVRLMPPSYVKPYAKRQQNDMADAEAICEAVTRPTMRFVPGEVAGTAECDSVAPDLVDPDPATHPDLQRNSQPHGGVWHWPPPLAGRDCTC